MLSVEYYLVRAQPLFQQFLDLINNNKIVHSLLGLFLVLYGSLAAPKLPRSISTLFNNTIFRLVIMFLIAYTASNDTSLAILTVVSLIVSLQTLGHHTISDKVADKVVQVTLKNIHTSTSQNDEQIDEQNDDIQNIDEATSTSVNKIETNITPYVGNELSLCN